MAEEGIPRIVDPAQGDKMVAALYRVPGKGQRARTALRRDSRALSYVRRSGTGGLGDPTVKSVPLDGRGIPNRNHGTR
jgi:hypothetical protein